jgi:hypothetical protein
VVKKLPEFLKSCLWSYDLNELDGEKFKKLVITQVLNYGDKKAVKWVEENYSQEEIRETVIHPTRGMWWREKLVKWLNYFGELVDPIKFEVAVIDLNNSRKILWNMFWRRIEIEKEQYAVSS